MEAIKLKVKSWILTARKAELSGYLFLHRFVIMDKSRWANLKGCVPLGWSAGSGSVIQDHSDHGASKVPMNPLWTRILRFVWRTMIWVILDHWSRSRSSQRNTPLAFGSCFKIPDVHTVVNSAVDCGWSFDSSSCFTFMGKLYNCLNLAL